MGIINLLLVLKRFFNNWMWLTTSFFLIVFLLFIPNSYAQFITDTNYEYHSDIKSVLDSCHARGYSKIDFIGVYKYQLIGKDRCVMSFTFLNDSILKYKESFPGDHEGLTPDSAYYVRKYDWYFKSDIHGNIIQKNNPPYMVSARDSMGYLIITDKIDSACSSNGLVYKSVYNQERKLIECTYSGETPLRFQRETYQYKNDTTIVRRIAGLIDKVWLDETQKTITTRVIKKRKIIIKQTKSGSRFAGEDGTTIIIKNYDRSGRLTQIEYRQESLPALFFQTEHLNIRYYKS